MNFSSFGEGVQRLASPVVWQIYARIVPGSWRKTTHAAAFKRKIRYLGYCSGAGHPWGALQIPAN
jgi:hypothetical protein